MSNKQNDKIIESLTETYLELGGDLKNIPEGISDNEKIDYLKKKIKQYN